MERRTLLRTLAVLGLAGCTTTREPPTAAPGSPRSAPSSPRARQSPPAAASPSATPGTNAAPSPPPSPEPSPTPRVRRVVSRELLELPPPAPGGQAHTITGLMLHHTAAPTSPAAEAPGRFRAHAVGHRDAGFVDVAYHWGVDVAGTLYQLRDPGVAGETFTDYDPAGWLLVVCEGNFEESPPTDAMLQAVADVFAAGAARHGVDPGTLLGHRDLAATACPGDNLQARLGDLQVMIADRLAAGGVTLEISDDPDLLPA